MKFCILLLLIITACDKQKSAPGPRAPEFSGSSASPGILKASLKDYRIPYYEAAAEPAQISEGPIQERDEPFRIADFGPAGTLPKEIKQASIYAVFSHPVVPLAQLGEPLDKEHYFTIHPPLQGVYRWYGSRLLAFEAESGILPQQRYTVTVSESLTSLGGRALTGNREFSFETERLSVTSWKVGTGQSWDYPSGVLPEDARRIVLGFSDPVDLTEIAKYIVITGGGRTWDFSLSRPDPSDQKEVQVTLEKTPPLDTDLLVKIIAGAKSQAGWLGSLKDEQYSFHTLRPFRFYEISGRSYDSPSIALNFNYPVETKNAEKYISIDGLPPLTPDNIKSYGELVILNKLPLEYEGTYTVRIAGPLKDTLGRALGADAVHTVQIGPARSYVHIPDSGAKMLEAAYPPKYVWETQNPKFLRRGIFLTDDPYQPPAEAGTNLENEGPRNKKRFFMEDLAPYLGTSGRGTVALTWDYQTNSPWDQKARHHWLTLQVTDIGITVRYAYNKTLVWANRISTGQPIPNAQVDLLNGPQTVRTGKTDLQGLGVFAFPDEAFVSQFDPPNLWERTGLRIRVRDAQGDQAEFIPNDSHNLWRFKVYETTPFQAERERPGIFLFTDRGIYRPGETVTFRGIDRSLRRGIYQPYEGPYTITVSSGGFQAPVIAKLSGTTTKTGGSYGSFTLPEALDPGDYTLSYKRGGAEQVLSFKVANFQRLRFEASLKIPDSLWYQGEKLAGIFSASYLAGGALSGAPCSWYWVKEPGFFNPGGKWEYWRFGPGKTDTRTYVGRGEGLLGPDGTKSITQETSLEGVEGSPYRYRLEVSAQDAARQEIAVKASAFVHPGSFYIAARLDSGKPKPESPSAYFLSAGNPGTLSWALVGPDGSAYPVSGAWKGSLEVQFILHRWKQIRQAGIGGRINFSWQKTEEVIEEDRVDIKTGAGTFAFTPKESGPWEIRLRSKDEKNRPILTCLNVYVTGGGWIYWGGEDPDAITLIPDKDRYSPGETAKILVRSPLPAGKYLLTLEREGLISEKIIDLDGSARTIDVPIDSSYIPIVYVSIASYTIRPGPPENSYDTPDLNKPRGLFGVTPLSIDHSSRRYQIAIETKGAYRPGETVEGALKVTLNGQPVSGAEVSFMAVDRGVVDLIDYHVPDPTEYFYNPARFPLGVHGADSRSLLVDPVTYTLSDLQGGDADESKLEERKDFRPTAVFEPYLVTGPDGIARVSFTLPDSLTGYRCTAVAVGIQEFGLAERDLRVSAPLTATAVLPRKLRWRDTGTLSLILTNHENKPADAEVSLSAEEASPAPLWDKVLAIDGPRVQTLQVPPGGTREIRFRVAAVGSGEARLTFTLRSPEVNERIRRTLRVERPVVLETVTTLGSLRPGDSFVEEGLILPGVVPEGTGSLQVTLAGSRLAHLKEALRYLLTYPYGCLEQRSAGLLPILAFGDYLDTFGLDSPVQNPRQTAQAELDLLSRYQHSDGSFPYWPGGLRGDVFVSLRMAHIGAWATQKGYRVLFSLDRLLRFLSSSEAMERLRDDSFLRGYALWVRAMLGEQIGAEITEILRTEPDLGLGGWSFVGLAGLELGRREAGLAAQKQIQRYLRPGPRTLDLEDSYTRSSQLWGAETDSYALALMVFQETAPEDDLTTRLANGLIERQRRGVWTNTASSFWGVAAFGRVADREAAFSAPQGLVSLGALPFLEGSPRMLLSMEKGFSQAPLSELARDALLPFRVERRAGTGPLYYTASLRYGLPAELARPRDEGLGVYVETFDPEGRRVSEGRYTPGKTYTRRVILSSSRDRTFVALRVPIPSGAEIIDAELVTSSTDPQEDSPDFSWSAPVQFIMDDEARFHWDRFPAGRQEVSFRFRAVMPGVYPTPPAQAECMYEEEVFGRAPGELAYIPEI